MIHSCCICQKIVLFCFSLRCGVSSVWIVFAINKAVGKHSCTSPLVAVSTVSDEHIPKSRIAGSWAVLLFDSSAPADGLFCPYFLMLMAKSGWARHRNCWYSPFSLPSFAELRHSVPVLFCPTFLVSFFLVSYFTQELFAYITYMLINDHWIKCRSFYGCDIFRLLYFPKTNLHVFEMCISVILHLEISFLLF